MLDEIIPTALHNQMMQSRLFAGTLATTELIKQHFDLSGTPFFREYTDHSFKHSIDVFRTACEIMPDGSQEIASSDDLNILLLACLFHDAGLHITEQIFLALTDKKNSAVQIPSFDFRSWPELWSDFIGEAKRFSSKRLISLFGDSAPINDPPREYGEMTARDRLLIGEFLRRHHPRFAHEFSLGAVSDATGGNFEFKMLDRTTQDIAGLIARSHGLELRATFDYIQHRYDLRDYNRVHIIYLMTLLRVADFLQIESGRAPEVFNKLHTIRSPFSDGEWRLHNSIENVTRSTLDPEAIFVATGPRTVHEYLRFERWIKGLQSELDTSWAVLGEVYGRFAQEGLDKLHLSIRRVRTNVEDKDIVQKRTRFVPDSIRFTVAEPELLQLLIAPLYGDNPLYGLRELVQNAADSVRELRHSVDGGRELAGHQLSIGGDVQIRVELSPTPTVTIADRGTGMTLDVVKNFFLRAGASFRHSDLWKQQFEDASGSSQIARAGRFGVGALAAFLIGERIEVYTRHFSDKSGNGVRFGTKIDEDEIEVIQTDGDIGTIVKIVSDEKRAKEISDYFLRIKAAPDFFNSDTIHMGVEITGGMKSSYETELEREYDELAAEALATEPSWVTVEGTRYEQVRWDRNPHRWKRHWGHVERQCGYLFCNELLVGALDAPSTELIIKDKNIGNAWSVVPPTISVVDNNGLLPLTLARTSLVTPENELGDAVLRSMWTRMLADFFYEAPSLPSGIAEMWTGGDWLFTSTWIPFIFAREGFSALDEARICALRPHRMIVLPNSERLDAALTSNFVDKRTVVVVSGQAGPQSPSDVLHFVSNSIYRRLQPNFHERFGGAHETFDEQHFVFPMDTFVDATRLRNAPKYLHSMHESGLSISLGKKKFIVVNRTGSPKSEKQAIGDFVRSYMKKVMTEKAILGR